MARLSLPAILGALCLTLFIAAGCRSCQQPPELPPPAPQAGQLRSASSQNPNLSPSSCVVVGYASLDIGVAPLEVHFSAEGLCTDTDGTFAWDFGDATTTQEQNPTHVYQAAGTYTARVTLADPEHDAVDSDEVEVTATAP